MTYAFFSNGSYNSDIGDTVNPRLSLSWDMNEDWNLRLLYGTAFRAPAISCGQD